MTSPPLPSFLAIAQQKKILLWNLVWLLFVCSCTIYIPVSWINSKFWILQTSIFEKSKFWSFGVKIENFQNPRWPFCRGLNITSLDVYGLRFTSNMYVLEAFKHSPLFDPKWRNMTSLKHYFLSQKSSRRIFFWNFARRRQIDAEWGTESLATISAVVFELSRKYGKGGGGNIYPPPARRGLRDRWLCFL